jgi:hypothetical protein
MKLRRDGITYIGPIEQPFEAAMDDLPGIHSSRRGVPTLRARRLDRQVRGTQEVGQCHFGIASTPVTMLGLWKYGRQPVGTRATAALNLQNAARNSSCESWAQV